MTIRRILFALLLLAACSSSPPTHFYALEAMPPGKPVSASPDRPIGIAAVHLPAVLDRTEIVRQAGGDRLDISETERWAAPLDEMVRQVLARDLALRLPAATVLPPGIRAPDGATMVVVDVAEFDADAAGEVRLDATWTVSGAEQRRTRLHAEHIAVPGAADFSSQPPAMSRALGEIADRIAAALGAAHS